MSSKKLLVVGELNVDLILNDIQGFPRIGAEIVANSMDFTLGSSSAIMASNISALGVDTSFCGVVGDDQFGEFVIEQLELKHVSTSFIKKSLSHKTGVTIVMSYDQNRANVTYCGAMNALKKDDIPWTNLRDFNHLHLSSYFLQEGIKKDITAIFRKAKNGGLSTSLDLQYDPEEKWEFDYKSCLPFVDIFFPNEDEIHALTAKNDLESALDELRPYCNIIALKLGKKGSRLIKDDMDIQAAPFLNKKYKDAIGAGDSFNAGFIQKFLDGASLEECLKNGNATGSLNTTCAGGTAAFSSQKHLEKELQKILNQHL